MCDPSEIWTGKASSYDRARPTPPPALLDLLTQVIQMPHPALVVDVGSGTGLSTAIWGERAERVIGIEPNADMRKEAVHKVEDHPYAAQIEYHEGVAHQTGLPDGCADIVTAAQSFHRMEPTATLAESAHFRFTREVLLHHIEQGDAARFLEMMRSNALSHQFQFTEQEIGFDRLSLAAFQSLGSEPIPWYVSYRVRIGIK